MAADTVTVWEAALKQGWTQDDLERQFLKEDPLLDMLEVRKPSVTIGLEAITPVWTGRAGGYTAVPTEGSSSLNAADSQELNRATWKYRRHWNQVEIDTAAVTQSQGSANAVAEVVSTEVEGKLSDTRKQITRQLFLDQTALIAQMKENTSTKTLKMEAATATGEYALGFQGIRNGWLVPGQQIDIGSTTEEALRLDKKEILTVVESESEPKITVAENTTTATTDYISIANARSGTTSYECNGFRNMSSESTTLGGLKPETVPGWKGQVVNAENASITRALVISLRRKIRQKGETPDWAFTSLKQVEYLENQLYAQVRFAKPGEIDTGDGESLMIGTLKVQGHQDCPDQDFTICKKDKLFLLRTDKPDWVPKKYGNGNILMWKQGTSFLVSALEYYLEFCTNRRNTIGMLRNLEIGA